MAAGPSALRSYLLRLSELVGRDDGERAAEACIALETKLASFCIPDEVLLQQSEAWRSRPYTDLSPRLQWLENIDHLATEFDPEHWRHYTRTKQLHIFARVLPRQWRESWHSLCEIAIIGSGTRTEFPDPRYRWLRLTSECRSQRSLLTAEYIRRHVSNDAIRRTRQIFSDIKVALGRTSRYSGFATGTVRRQAQRRLSMIRLSIEGVDAIQRFPPIETRADDLVGNLARIHRGEFDAQMNRIRPSAAIGATMDASFCPHHSEVLLSADFLLTPWIDDSLDDAYHDGSHGFFGGHEIGHDFDHGRLEMDSGETRSTWWPKQDRKEFNQRMQRFRSLMRNAVHRPGAPCLVWSTLDEDYSDFCSFIAA